jgi:peptidoglycan-associated lipoprotein
MNRNLKMQVVRMGAVLLALSLLIFAVGCKKKVPPPPPPPQPVPIQQTVAPPKAIINSFTVEPSTIEKGGSATLRWSISNANDMAIDQGVGAVQSQGSRQVFPSATTTYTLSARGPGGDDSKTATVEVTSPPPPPPPPPPQNVETSEQIINRDVKDVYFDYDKNDIRGDQQTVLQGDADVLKKVFGNDAVITVRVEGNCDERGSAEYNLALGDRRAQAAKDYLVQLGVSADKLKTISYGKEKPVCTEATEDCYQRNRHDHFSPVQP